jgi:ATP-binding cassette subfamily B protein
MKAPASSLSQVSIPILFARLTRVAWRSFLAHSAGVVFFITSRLVPGLIVQAVFDTLTGEAAVGLNLTSLVAMLMMVELLRVGANLLLTYQGETFRFRLKALLRKNILTDIYRRPGAEAQPVTPGDALNRFDHDVAEVSDFPTWIPYVVGHTLFAIIAFVIMVRINATITLVVVLPLLGVILITNAARDRLLKYYQASRETDSLVTGFLGEVFSAVQAIKVADAERSVMGRFHRLNDRRRVANLRRRLMDDLLEWAFRNLSDLGLGVVLLLTGELIRAGTFTIGDFSLFATYIWFIVRFPSTVGGFFADYRTQAVSLDRLAALQTEPDLERLIEPGPVYLRSEPPRIRFTTLEGGDQLASLTVQGLTYRHPTTGRGIDRIDLNIRPGSLTVVTGEVGSGKTTLLQVLLGLLPRDAGEIFWNGVPVKAPAEFFVPPRCAYTPQVPRLFSLPLRDNLLLGLPDDQVDLPAALDLAMLTPDIENLERGLDTVVGPRGVRLSGGQVQRAAAARMFVRRPALLVFDDLSSALDVETEAQLWRALFGTQEDSITPAPTALMISHRRPLLRRADHILVLQEGHLAAEGDLETLLRTSNVMVRLWEGA